VIQAIFFDFNGVIINDERIHLKAYREVLGSEGINLSDDDYYGSLGMDDVAFVRAAYARAGQSAEDTKTRELINREHALHRQLISEELPVAAGVVTFIKEAARVYQLGLVSMAERSEIEHVLKLTSLDKCFLLMVSAEPGLKHKPAPDSYRRALESLNQIRRMNRNLPLLSSECLVIEDAPPGVLAARAAGMRTLAVTTTVAADTLRAAGAEVVTPNLADWNTDAVHHLFD
jgi:HAD superfamily hydrolase (TIGR01509 family)